MRKKILFVATRQFWPTTCGKKVTLYYNCKGLYDEYAYDIYLFCFADKNTDKQLIKPEFIKEVTYADVPNLKHSIMNILMYSFGNKAWPIQNSLYFSPAIAKRLHEYYLKISPNVLIIDMVRLVPYVEVFRNEVIKKILIVDDLLAKRYRRQIKFANSGNVTGQYSRNLPGILNKLINIHFIRSIILNYEAKKIDVYEKKFADLFDYITFISPIETQEYNQHNDTNKGITLTMGTNIEYYSQGDTIEHREHSLSIVGNYLTAANADSIKMICKEIIPKLDNKVKYYVIGKCPDELRKCLECSKVEILGFVTDLRAVVKSTDIYLSPLVYGTGIKTKIVEAMAMGMPVVTNSIGSEGLNVTNGKELFIVDDNDSMIEVINRLFDNPELRYEVGQAAQKFIRENYSWKNVYTSFSKMGL